MGLSNDLISQFVKITKDNESGKKESTAYGSIVKYNNKTYVKLDGSELLTPVTTTTDVEENERVTVTIKNHTATVTGNISSPSARTDTVKEIDKEVTVIGNKISEFEIVIADKVSTTELDAERAKIEQLQAENVTISGKLTANEADISKLETDNITINEKLTAAEADIDKLSVDNVTISGKVSAAEADIKNIKADNVTISGKVTANEADISKLETDNAVINEKLVANSADINVLEADYATINGKVSANEASINNLEATMMTSDHAVIKNLQSDVAEIDTLIFGSASGDVIQTSFANAVIAQLGNAQIKSAMIESVTASQITAGDIITNNVRVMSEDGSLVISDETLQISDGTRVRVQIGKDASNDYSISIWDASGNLMFSKGGITDAAIKNAIIRNDMVAANANISASKLDIDSLFTEINNSSKTIKSTKVYLDEKGQTLDAAFTSMSTDVNGIRGTVESQGTQLSVMQGQIANKIWQTDIDTTIDKLEIGGRNLIPRQENSSATHNGITVTGTDYVYRIHGTNTKTTPGNYGVGEWMKSNGHILEPGEIYTLSTSVPLPPGLYLGWNGENSAGTGVMLKYLHGDGATKSITYTIPSDYRTVMHGFFGVDVEKCGTVDVSFRIKLEKGNKATDWTPAPEDVEGEISTLDTKYSEVKQTVDGLSTTVAAHTTQISNKADSSTVTTVNNKVSALEQNLDGFKTTVSNTYTTKTDFDNLQIGGRNLLRNSRLIKPSSNNAGLYPIGLETVTENNITFYRVTRGSVDLNPTTFSIYNTIGKDSFNHTEMNGKTVVLSFKARASHATKMTLMSYATDPMTTFSKNNASESITTEWMTYTQVVDEFPDMSNMHCVRFSPMNITIPSGVNVSDFYIDVREWKFELGNKATDWTPAPEDADGKYGTKTEINQLSDRITANVTETTALGTRMSTVEQKADGLTVSLSNTNSKIDNLEVGGRNLIQKSQIIAHTCVANFENTDSITITYVDSSNTSALIFDTLLSPGVYTINATNANGSTFRLLSSSRIHNGFIYNATYNRYGLPYYFDITDMPYTFTLTAESKLGMVPLYPNGTTQTIHNLKLEKGSKATDWTPAPEDVDASISNAQSTANTASSKADTAQSTANTAVTNAATAQSTANTANSTANSVKTDLADNYTKKTLPDTRNDNQSPDWYMLNYPRQIITEFKYSSVIGLSGETYCSLTTTVPWGDSSGGYPKQHAKVGSKEYWRVGTSATAWSSWIDAYGTAQNASKTATNYLNFSNGGLVVGNMTASTLGNNVLIDNDSVDIRNGTTTLASYQANKIELAKNSPSAVIDMCSGTAQFTNKNDVSGIDWYRLGITSRDAIGLETGGEVTMDTHNENAAGEYADGIFRMSSCQPWNMNLYGFEEAYAHLIVKNYISGILKQAKLEMYPQLGTNLLHTHKAGTAGVYLYGGGGSGDTWSEVSRMDLEAEAINTKTSSFKMTTNNSKIYGKDPNGVEKAVFIPQNQYGNTIVGYENYTTGKGNTNLYGQDLNFSSSEAGNVTYRPYYRGNGLTTEGDTINITIRTAGFVTSSGAGVQFTVPLAKPIIGNPTVTASSVNGFQLRCNGYYTHGSSASSYATPSSYSVTTTNGGNNVVITATFSNTTNISNDTVSLGARNNSPIGIYWSGKLTITFG